MIYACLAALLELTLFWLLFEESVKLEHTISYGNILSTGAALVGAVGAYYALKGQVKSLGDRLSVHRRELDKKTQDVDQLTTSIGGLQVTMATLNVTVANLASQFDKFDKRFDALNTKVDETKEEVLKKNGGHEKRRR